MLRAGHAIYLMAKTIGNAEFVANQIGDTVEVVRTNYAGRTNKKTAVSEVAKIIYA